MEEVKFYVAGVRFHQLKKCIGELSEGDKLHLVPEPENPYDSNAVRIEHFSPAAETAYMLGYVPKKFSSKVSAYIEAFTNVTCEITKLVPSADPWEQLEVTISAEED